MKIHVLLKKEELDGQRLPGKIVVVLDILFATSSIVAALANGAQEVVPQRLLLAPRPAGGRPRLHHRAELPRTDTVSSFESHRADRLDLAQQILLGPDRPGERRRGQEHSAHRRHPSHAASVPSQE